MNSDFKILKTQEKVENNGFDRAVTPENSWWGWAAWFSKS